LKIDTSQEISRSDHKKYDQAEVHFLNGLAARKRFHGELSGFELESEIMIYCDILNHLGRTNEVADIEEALCACLYGPDREYVQYAPETQTIISSVKETLVHNDLEKSIHALHNAMVTLPGVIAKQESIISSSDPFRELKMRAQASPYRWVRSKLAGILRLKCEQDNDNNLLVEAASLLRQIVAESNDQTDRLNLMLTLLDLATADDTLYDEVEQLIAKSPKCTASLYTTTLMMYRRTGSTRESHAAMRAAVEANPHVPKVLATGPDSEEECTRSRCRELTEAKKYCLQASKQWHATPGALKFMIEVLAGSLPKASARISMR
jgi:hypothetical protein